MQFVCNSIFFGQELTKNLPMTNRVYAYRLMQVAPEVNIGLGSAKWMGVTHGQDLVFLFQPQATKNDFPAHHLSHRMLADWTSFAKVGHPALFLWGESFNRDLNDFNTRYFHLESGHFHMVSGGFEDTCERIWKPIIFK